MPASTPKPRWKRVMIKLYGEALMGRQPHPGDDIAPGAYVAGVDNLERHALDERPAAWRQDLGGGVEILIDNPLEDVDAELVNA